MTHSIHIPGQNVETRKQAREEAICLLFIGIGILIFAWIFLPGYTHSPTDALFGSIVISLIGGMVIVCSIYLLFRSNQYPEEEAGEPKK